MVVAAKNENVQKPQSLKKKSTTKNNNNSSSSNSSNSNNNLSPTRPPIKPAESHQKTSTSLGSKIHAQRKFAQGASITIGHSPVKHAKISIKKRVEKKALPLSPTFIPAKRPKTEDFLTFLCYRGTPVLPAGLDVFNCPPETEAHCSDDNNDEGVKKLVETPEKNVVSTNPAVEPTPRASASSNHASSSSSGNYNASSNGKSKDKSSNNTPAKSSTNSQTAEASSNRKSPGLKRIPDVMVVVKQAEKAIAAFGKVRKDLTTALLKPNRINERDARFAMTALKLKYQEKRLAKSKPASSIAVASKITKKGRNVILTRSKAHTLPARGEKPKVTVKKKKELITQKLRKESPSQSRNAPSPDIIYGVSSHSKNAAKKTSPSKSSSKSNSASSDSSSNSSNNSSSESSNNNDSDESSSESSEEEEEAAAVAPAVGRSLRSGKEVVSQQPKKPASNNNNNSKPAKISKPTRVSTRSARRISTSPLRELPMYGVQKRKPNKSDSKKNNNDKQKNDSGQASHRPTRKTKETASICLGLINNFSSDEENSTDKPADDDDSSGTSSSSEAEYLEKQYNASLKREEENNKNAKSKKAAPPPKNNSSKQKQKEVTKSKAKTQNPPKKGSTTTTATGKNRPAKRILRSQSTRETISKQKSKGEPGRVATRRFSVPVTNDRTPEGAARKSASVYPRWKGSYRSSSDSSDESDTTEDDDDDDDNAGEGEDEESSEEKSSVESKTTTTSFASKKRASLVRTSNSKPTGLAARKSATSTPVKVPPITKPPPRKRPSTDTKAAKRMKSRSISRESDSEEDEAEEEEKSEKSQVKKVIIEIQRDEEPSEKSSSESSSGEEEEEESEETSSDEEAKPVVQKTSIAIQVDMDSEENVDMNQMYASPPESVSSGTPPMNSSSSSCGTYTDMPSFMPSINLTPHPSLPFVPFSAPGAPGPSFYPTLHLNPPVVSNIHVLAARGTQEFSLGHPGITMNIPATLSMQSYGAAMGPPLLQPNTMCFSSTSISAATLQTHIRSVAANLDIPLVRPIIGSDPLNIPFPRAPMTPMGAPGISMTRPMPVWQGDPTRPHSSAFRVPMNTNVAGGLANDKLARAPMSNNNLLPLSVVHPQGQQSRVTNTSQHHHHQHPSIGVNAVRRTLTGASPNTPGYSILQNLPNVSIVPRFDRNSKPVVCPPDQEALEKKLKEEKTAEAASSSNNNNNNSSSSSSHSKTKDKREKGSRKKKGMIIPHPSSPLTVRKDSANPVTYCGTSKKVAKSCSTSMDEKPTVTVKESSSDPFIKLLQLKKAGSDGKVSKNAVNKSSGGSQSQPATTSTSLKEPKKLENCNSSSPPVQEDIKGSNKWTENNSHKVPLSCSNGGERTMEAPTYCPTEEQFQDPLKYIEKIRPEAEKYGIARIIPPRSFRPDCNVDDDMRFTAYNHYIHKMFQRWGPNVHETMAIKEHLRNTDVDTSSVPVIGGMEVDLCTLYHTVQSFGGLKETIEKQKWSKVSDAMHIPKAANDRVSKLDSIYVKYVLPYETLSESERKRLLNKVERNWNARQEKLSRRADQSESESSDEDPLEEVDDCIIKGKSTPLTSYYRVARNTKTMLFPSKEPSSSEVEEEYWKMVRKRTRHLCVYSGSIDCAGVGWGFPLPKPSSKHPWNLKVLANSPGSVLRSMGPVMGATVPTLHVGMIFTTYCWYRDPHGLPWIEYLHSGGNKIWYVIPAAAENKFRQVLKEVMPLQCKNKKIWLASDSAMIPPEILQEKGVPLYRTVQNPGEFLVVFPKAFTSAICTGYVVSESVCYAPVEWLDSAPQTFNDIKSSKEPPVFALEQLLVSIVQDHHKVSLDVLERVHGPMERILKEEFGMRKRLSEMGVKSGKLCKNSNSEKVSKKKRKQEDEAPQCDICNYILHLSLVNNETREFTYCLKHAVEYLQKHKSHVKSSVIRYDYTQEELTASMTEVSNRLSNS